MMMILTFLPEPTLSQLMAVAVTITLLYAVLFRAQKTVSVLDADAIEKLGLELLLRVNSRFANKRVRQFLFMMYFGIDARDCVVLWEMLHQSGWLMGVPTPGVKHVLWSLLVLKQDIPFREIAAICGCNESTLWHRTGFYLRGIASLASLSIKIVS